MKIRLKANSKIIKLSNNSNSGDLLKNTSIALCTVCSDSYIKGTKSLIYSFLENNNWFSHDIVIFFNRKYSAISDHNKRSLLKLYNKIYFKEVHSDEYDQIIKRFLKLESSLKRLVPSFFTIEAFDLSNKYHKILFLDSDMLVLKDISKLFSIEGTLLATKRKNGGFNCGFFVIDNSSTNKCLKKDILKLAHVVENMRLADETLMNYCIKDFVQLDRKYNSYNEIHNDTKIIHYIGKFKPWNKKLNTKIQTVWEDYYRKAKIMCQPKLL